MQGAMWKYIYFYSEKNTLQDDILLMSHDTTAWSKREWWRLGLTGVPW